MRLIDGARRADPSGTDKFQHSPSSPPGPCCAGLQRVVARPVASPEIACFRRSVYPREITGPDALTE